LVSDDLEPDDLPEDDLDEDDETEEDLDALARELFGPDPLVFGEPDDGDDRAPTPGERVLYALGQLYRLHLAGRLPVHPNAFDVEDVVRILGLTAALEFVTEDRHGQHYHFPAEVLYVNPTQPFPWRLLGAWEWAGEQEADSFWAEGWD
jgi:hypothetical protein